MKNRTVRFLRFLVKLWLYIVSASVIVGSLGILIFQGVSKFWEIMSPFNFSNFIVIVALLTPTFILNKIADKIEKGELKDSFTKQIN